MQLYYQVWRNALREEDAVLQAEPQCTLNMSSGSSTAAEMQSSYTADLTCAWHEIRALKWHIAILLLLLLSCFSHVRLSVTPETAAH